MLSHRIRMRLLALVLQVTLYSNVAFGFCMLFMLLEVLEFSAGWKEYFFNIWNIMDWTNFALFLLFYSQLINLRSYEADRNCSPFCLDVGYCDDWLVMNTMMDAKTTLSYCLCIQMLKVIKFTDSLVPKMSLATSVLKKASVELLFFSFVFIISMVAFSQVGLVPPAHPSAPCCSLLRPASPSSQRRSARLSMLGSSSSSPSAPSWRATIRRPAPSSPSLAGECHLECLPECHEHHP